jgi:TrmH family RNA methyltransferase
VLVEPQDLVNIAGAFRIAKNFGLEQVRLVTPREFDAYRIEGIAHNTADLVAGATRHATLEEAISDCVWVVALTARERRAKRTVLRPAAAAEQLTIRAGGGTVAVVAGREDKGLTNAELDRCHALVTIPTSASYRSLNLQQAVAIMAYECWRARAGEGPGLKGPRRPAGAATADQQERLFADWERALGAIDFFKTRQPEFVMRSLREMLFRADLDGREATLLRAMALEVVRYLERHGMPADTKAS